MARPPRTTFHSARPSFLCCTPRMPTTRSCSACFPAIVHVSISTKLMLKSMFNSNIFYAVIFTRMDIPWPGFTGDSIRTSLLPCHGLLSPPRLVPWLTLVLTNFKNVRALRRSLGQTLSSFNFFLSVTSFIWVLPLDRRLLPIVTLHIAGSTCLARKRETQTSTCNSHHFIPFLDFRNCLSFQYPLSVTSPTSACNPKSTRMILKPRARHAHLTAAWNSTFPLESLMNGRC